MIYRYLKQIVRISSRRALLLTGFTGCFFTTVVLSFTTESYPFSFFLLVFSLLMLSREYMLTGYIKGRTILFLSFLCGGITITNAAKPTMALFLNKAPFWRKIRTGFKVMLPFVICVAAVMGFYTSKRNCSTRKARLLSKRPGNSDSILSTTRHSANKHWSISGAIRL